MDVMIDLETMGNSARAAFVQIGAVRFDAFGTPLPEEVSNDTNTLLLNVDLDSLLKLGMRVDASTMMWWMQQSNEARASLASPTPVDVRVAISKLKTFVTNGGKDWKTVKVWSKGPSFDITIIGEAMRAMGDKWGICSYTNERCVRTVLDWAGIDDKWSERDSGYHNALADSWHQARMVQEAARVLGKRLL